MPQFFYRLCGVLCVTCIWSSSSVAATDAAQLCDHAAHIASEKSGVPLSVLRAILLTETGRKAGGKMKSWAWTVNMEGKGVWFDDPETARAYVYKHYKRGARSFDVGCFQINYKWHGQEFASIEEMFEPQANANYAARFLSNLHQEFGSWEEAAGAYHSRTPKFAEKYKKRFNSFRANLTDDPPALSRATQRVVSVRAPVIPRVNTFPLLQSGSSSRGIGSLVPVSSGRGSLFGARSQP